MKTTVALASSINSKKIAHNFQVEIQLEKLIPYIASLALKNKSKNKSILFGLITAKEIHTEKASGRSIFKK